jgi:hypothetical protein
MRGVKYLVLSNDAAMSFSYFSPHTPDLPPQKEYVKKLRPTKGNSVRTAIKKNCL